MKTDDLPSKGQRSSVLPFLYSEVSGKIIVIRQQEVIADADVAALYGVETKRINEAVRNNPDKFPAAYMFVLTNEEVHYLRSKISTTKVSSKSRMLPKSLRKEAYTCLQQYYEVSEH